MSLLLHLYLEIQLALQLFLKLLELSIGFLLVLLLVWALLVPGNSAEASLEGLVFELLDLLGDLSDLVTVFFFANEEALNVHVPENAVKLRF